MAKTNSKSSTIRPKPLSTKAGYKPKAGKKKTRYGDGGQLKKK